MATDKSEEALAELQFSFVCFLVGQHYDSFENWKQILKLFCQCDKALSDKPDIFMHLIQDLHFQVRFHKSRIMEFDIRLNRYIFRSCNAINTLYSDKRPLDSYASPDQNRGEKKK